MGRVLIPNASRAVFTPGFNAWVALHQFPDGRIWICQQLDDGTWYSRFEATPQAALELKNAGALDFPILLTAEQRREHPDWPQSAPWGLVCVHERQCVRNHGQSPFELAAVGGLAPEELYRVLLDRDSAPILPEAAIEAIRRRVELYLVAEAAKRGGVEA